MIHVMKDRIKRGLENVIEFYNQKKSHDRIIVMVKSIGCELHCLFLNPNSATGCVALTKLLTYPLSASDSESIK